VFSLFVAAVVMTLVQWKYHIVYLCISSLGSWKKPKESMCSLHLPENAFSWTSSRTILKKTLALYIFILKVWYLQAKVLILSIVSWKNILKTTFVITIDADFLIE
jgi:hypothetical protein